MPWFIFCAVFVVGMVYSTLSAQLDPLWMNNGRLLMPLLAGLLVGVPKLISTLKERAQQ